MTFTGNWKERDEMQKKNIYIFPGESYTKANRGEKIIEND